MLIKRILNKMLAVGDIDIDIIDYDNNWYTYYIVVNEKIYEKFNLQFFFDIKNSTNLFDINLDNNDPEINYIQI